MNSVALVVTAGATAAALLAPPAGATGSTSGAPRYASFSGFADPRSGGTSSTCREVLTTGPLTPLPCTASFDVTASNGLCSARRGADVAEFDYTSHTTGFSMLDVRLSTTAENGVGYLVGQGVRGSEVFSVRIAIAALCASEQASGPFDGGLLYV